MSRPSVSIQFQSITIQRAAKGVIVICLRNLRYLLIVPRLHHPLRNSVVAWLTIQEYASLDSSALHDMDSESTILVVIDICLQFLRNVVRKPESSQSRSESLYDPHDTFLHC